MSDEFNGGSILTAADDTPVESAPPPTSNEGRRQGDDAGAVEAQTYDSNDWRAALPDDIKNSQTLEKFTTAEGLARSYVNLERRLGDHLPMPKTDEDFNEVYTKLGRPEAPDKYEFKPLELPDGMEHDTDGEEYFRQVVHKAGLSPRQAEQLHKDYFGLMSQRYAEGQKLQEQAREEAGRKLQAKHGASFEAVKSGARSVLKQHATPEFLERLDQTGMGNDPHMIEVFASISKAMNGETTLANNNTGQASTPGDAMKALEDFRAQHTAALFDGDHPEHRTRLKELTRLSQLAYPS